MYTFHIFMYQLQILINKYTPKPWSNQSNFKMDDLS